MKRNKGIEHLEHVFSIVAKYGYWASLLLEDCNATDVFVDGATPT